MKKRITYLDLIRIIACIAVFTCHFNAAVCGLQPDGSLLYPGNRVAPIHVMGGVYMGDFGVILFFILTGAALELSASNHPGMTTGDFYRKRIVSIYPMYWITWLIFTVLGFFLNHGLSPAPLWHLIPSILGLDGYLLTLGLPGGGFYQVGEWYLGCLMLVYLFYPILDKWSRKAPVPTVLVLLFFHQVMKFELGSIFFAHRFLEVLFGMYLVRYLKEPKWTHALFAYVVMTAAVFGRSHFHPFTYSLVIMMCLFVLFAWGGSFLKREDQMARISKLGKLTFPFYLCHHRIIALLTAPFGVGDQGMRNIIFLYVLTLVIVTVSALGIQKLTERLMKPLLAGNT